MIDGYLKVAAITPNVRVADVEFNCNEICKCIDEAVGKKVKLMVFPELCITGYTCQDVVYSSHNIIAENGNVLCESERFSENMIISEIDLEYLEAERRRMTTYEPDSFAEYERIGFSLSKENTELTRYIDFKPFVPSETAECDLRCNEILTIQAMGLKKRLEHVGCKTAVIGVSGGLDSTLALLVIAKAYDYLKSDRWPFRLEEILGCHLMPV